ncbi:MAG: hypothetical protein GX986_09645 [Firmicutes bacterium]|nr:hypothetical protein [Bacillota bacterium]
MEIAKQIKGAVKLASNIRFGIAKTGITPPTGLPLSGYSGRSGGAVGVANPLYARAFSVFDKIEEKRLVLVVCDLLALDPSVLECFRSLAQEELGLNPQDIFVCVTHTHSGPAYGRLSRFASSLDKEESQAGRRWLQGLPKLMLQAMEKAISSENDAQIGFAKAEVDISVNRRLLDPFGEIRLAPNPRGITDPEVLVLQARDAKTHETLGTLVNYPCHPVVLCEDNLYYTGDYPYFAVESMENKTGAPAIFVNGACGNINPIRRGSFETAQWMGEELASAACEGLEAIAWHDEAPIAVDLDTVMVPWSNYPSVRQVEKYLEAAREALDRHISPGDHEGHRLESEVARAQRMLHQVKRRWEWVEAVIDKDTQSVISEMQVARLGPAAFVTLPGEFFVEIGLSIKESSPHFPTFILGYTGGYIGYVPIREAYSQGGYEVQSSLVGEGAGEIFVEKALEMLRRISEHSK